MYTGNHILREQASKPAAQSTPASDTVQVPANAPAAAATAVPEDHRLGTLALQGAAYVGFAAWTIDTARWAISAPLNVKNHTLGKWILAITPFGPGVHNGIAPYDHGIYKKLYAAANTLKSSLAAVELAAAGVNLALGVKHGIDHANREDSNPAAAGARAIVQTREGRTGLLAAAVPGFTWGAILKEGWSARKDGIGAVLKAGQTSELRGNTRIMWALAAATPIMLLNQAGMFDFLDMDRTDTRDTKRVLWDATRRLPSSIRDVQTPYIPKAWVDWTLPEELRTKESDAPVA